MLYADFMSSLESHPEVERTIAELRAWCDAERGRRVRFVQVFDISRQAIHDWFTRKSDPSASALFKIRDFLASESAQSQPCAPVLSRPVKQRRRKAQQRGRKAK